MLEVSLRDNNKTIQQKKELDNKLRKISKLSRLLLGLGRLYLLKNQQLKNGVECCVLATVV